MKKVMVALLLLAAPSAVAAQARPASQQASTGVNQKNATKLSETEHSAEKAREARESMYKRLDQRAKRAVNSMCVECLGAQYNRPSPETPLTLSDEVSAMRGEPELETEP
jgi:cytochrome c553